MNLINHLHKELSEEVRLINRFITERIISATSQELVKEVSSHLIVNTGGKKIRALLTLLTSKMFGISQENTNHIKLATAVELIHAATLLHDDVLDNSKVRRFKPTANLIWGNQTSILVGDYLFSQAFRLMVETNSIPALDILSDASSVIVQGEIMQLEKKDTFINLLDYNSIISAKTAALFSAACEVGAIITTQSSENQIAVKNYGLCLGKIFQITDDILDYFGDEAQIGKNIGDDFIEGKITIPLIFLKSYLQQKNLLAEENKLLNIMSAKTRSLEDFMTVKKLLANTPVQEQLVEYLKDLQTEAIGYIDHIKFYNKYRDFLIDLVGYILKRFH